MGAAVSTPWFCVVDPEFKNTTPIGHYVIYDRAVCEAAERLGYRTLILGRKTIDATHVGGTPFVPAFTYGIWETDPAYHLNGRGERRGRMRAGYRFFREPRSALAPFRLKSETLFVFVQSVYGLQIFGWALFSLWSWLVRGSKVAILLRYQHEFYDDDVSTLGFRILEWLVWAGRVRFVTDSQRLADDYSVLTKAPFDVVPIPHAQMPAPAEMAKAGSRLRFGTLGGARDEKGIGEIVDAIELLNRHNLASDIQFVLHVHSSWPDAITEKLAKFKVRVPENVKLIEDPLDDEEYRKLLYSLDVLVLPYWRSIYRSRTSGPLTEGVATGKVAIVTRDTWLHDELKQHGAGVTCEDRSPVDLARAIKETAARFEELHCAAQVRRYTRPSITMQSNLLRRSRLCSSPKKCRWIGALASSSPPDSIVSSSNIRSWRCHRSVSHVDRVLPQSLPTMMSSPIRYAPPGFGNWFCGSNAEACVARIMRSPLRRETANSSLHRA